MIEGTFLKTREEELKAGRARLKAFADVNPNKDMKRDLESRFKDADREAEDDLKRRDEILNAGRSDDRFRDHANAAIADQMQTALEAAGHTYDRDEKIIDAEQQREAERLEGHVDTKEVDELVMDHVTAQAVNQPVVLAENEGRMSTYDGVYNLNPDVPKTRKQAEELARQLTPSSKETVKPGVTRSNRDQENDEQRKNAPVAAKAVKKMPDIAPKVEAEVSIDNLLK